MGNKLFGVDIAGIINANIGPGVNDAILIKVSPGTRTPGSLTGGTNPTTTNHACKGFLDSLRKKHMEASLTQEGDILINLVGDSIAGGQVPQPGDRITIRGATYNVVSVDVDPADALYECVARSG